VLSKSLAILRVDSDTGSLFASEAVSVGKELQAVKADM
jgi:hypothetical protein